MNVYIYRAALLCDDCGTAYRAKLLNIGALDTGDSDDFPQGPYGNGGGEADTPQHCDHCREFLENPLTPDGVAYVLGQASDTGGNRGKVVAQWLDFYGLADQPTILSDAEAYSIASQWGSLIRAGDPGACFYGFNIDDGRPQDEPHRQACIAWIKGHCLPGANAEDTVELSKLLAYFANVTPKA